ncbi:MAG TPA: hypothetical protein VL654_06235 [Casimicrobiaceae bacterium]|nr:hypothetical protein [Casimicrobiaceae bacterium]
MPQYLILYSPDGASSGPAGAVQDAARAHDALYPGQRRERLPGARLHGWLAAADVVDNAYWRSANHGLEVVATGTWFAPGIASLAELGERIADEGVEAVAGQLEGPYALVVFDRRRARAQVVTDLAGTLHIFVAEHAGGWVIGTSSAWLAALTGASLDPIGTHEFLATGIVYEGRTLWQRVRKIGQSTVATLLSGGVVDERRYWSFANIVPERDDFATSILRLARAMPDAARAIGARHTRVLCDITAGYDSRATIAAFLMADVPFAGTVSGPEESRDVVISRAIAARFDIPHVHAAPALRGDAAEFEDAIALTDGECDAADYARVAAIHRQHARDYQISVNGSFGELARGYWWELLWPSIGADEPLDAAMLARRRFAAARYDSTLFADTSFDLATHMRDVIERVNRPLRGMPNTTLLDHAYFALRMHRWQGRIASSTARIWPNVSLFAFRSVLEPVLEARASSRIRSGLIRSLLARYLPALANYPLEAGHPSAPLRITNIHRFWPLVPHYGARIGRKLAPPASGRARGAQTAQKPQRRLTPQEVDLLMASDVFARDRLQPWLEAASPSAQYSRLLTLGAVLRRVDSARPRGRREALPPVMEEARGY